MKNVYMVFTYNTDGRDGGYDHFNGEFSTLEEAILCADRRWRYLTARERAVRETYVSAWQVPDDIEIGNGDAMSWVYGDCGGDGDVVYRPDCVTNSYGVLIRYDIAVNLMDDDIREELHAELAPCTDQEFFDAYSKAHAERFGEEWIPDTRNPIL